MLRFAGLDVMVQISEIKVFIYVCFLEIYLLARSLMDLHIHWIRWQSHARLCILVVRQISVCIAQWFRPITCICVWFLCLQPHTWHYYGTSYQWLIVTLAYLAPLLRYSDLLLKIANFFHHCLIYCSRSGWPLLNFWKSFVDPETVESFGEPTAKILLFWCSDIHGHRRTCFAIAKTASAQHAAMLTPCNKCVWLIDWSIDWSIRSIIHWINPSVMSVDRWISSYPSIRSQF